MGQVAHRSAENSRFHLFANQGRVSVLDRVEMRLGSLPYEARLLDSLSAETVDRIVKAVFSEENYFNVLERFPTPKSSPQGDQKGPYLDNLALNVASTCNLGCSYCYANLGAYRSGESAGMSPSDAILAVRKAASTFAQIGNIQFMGGEPTLAVPTIRAVGHEISRLCAEGELAGAPSYTMVSNGILISNSVIDLCREMNIEVTISLDGPAEVQDRARPRKGGGRSYHKVREGISKLMDSEVSLGFEPTYSRYHIEAGMSLVDLCEWFSSEFSVDELHAPPASGNEFSADGIALTVEEKVREYSRVTRWGVVNVKDKGVLRMHAFTRRLFDSFAKRESNVEICPAGNSQISIAGNGDVSPCWMFTDVPELVIGNAFAGPELFNSQANSVIAELRQYELTNHKDCNRCLAQPVCFGCKAADFNGSGNLESRLDCDYMRAMVISFIDELMAAPGQSSAFPLGEVLWAQHLLNSGAM